ncbi:MAG: 3-isopropylmalate dehydratase small subunit [Synergistaceae bacterium]|jgi:3-isopropylmalate/(R)-2-methylmalate dehydratase small subunit|nr:3-isopropylmalate dehydratase small subunit [Synergistaceae bacterium]
MSRCWKLGDNVSTDEILPFQYMVLTDPSELGRHILGSVKPGFAEQLTRGDVLVAGLNFGYGSSREHAPLALKGAGIGAVVARSFARIFFRNCINIGLPAIVCSAAVDGICEGDSIGIGLQSGVIQNETSGARYAFAPFPPFIMEYVENGGLINTLNKRNSDPV